MQCVLGFSKAADGSLLVLAEVASEISATVPSGTSATRYSDENIFLYYLVLADLDEPSTTSLIANVLLMMSGRCEESSWTFVDVSERQFFALGLSLPAKNSMSKVGMSSDSVAEACDFPTDIHFRDVLMQSPTAVCMLVGPQHTFSFINPAYVRMMGRRQDDLILGRTVRDVLPELHGQPFFGLLDMVFRTGRPYTGTEIPAHLRDEHSGVMKDHYFDFVYHPVRDHGGDICGILVHANDVTERVLERHVSETREAKLYEQWAELEGIYRKSPVGMALVSVHDYRILRVNEVNASFLGFPGDELVGREIFTLFPELGELRGLYERVAAGEAVRNVHFNVTGSLTGAPDRHLLLNFSPVLDAYGHIEAIASTAVDVTHEVEEEREYHFELDLSTCTANLLFAK